MSSTSSSSKRLPYLRFPYYRTVRITYLFHVCHWRRSSHCPEAVSINMLIYLNGHRLESKYSGIFKIYNSLQHTIRNMCNIFTSVIITGGERRVDTRKFIIEKCVCCLSAINFIHFAYVSSYIFLRQYVLEVATISSTTFLNSTTQVRNDTATHVFHNSSAHLNEHSSHLKFIGCFSREQPVLQETLRKKTQRFRSGLGSGQNCYNFDDPSRRVGQKQCSRSPERRFQYASHIFVRLVDNIVPNRVMGEMSA